MFPGKPLQSETHDQVFAFAGKDVILPCHLATSIDPSHVTAVEWSRVDGRSPLIVHVLRDGKDLVKEKAPEYLNRTSMIRDGSLKLHSVQHQDSGRYRYDATTFICQQIMNKVESERLAASDTQTFHLQKWSPPGVTLGRAVLPPS